MPRRNYKKKETSKGLNKQEVNLSQSSVGELQEVKREVPSETTSSITGLEAFLANEEGKPGMPVVVTPRKNLLGGYVFELWTNNGKESQLLEQDLVVALEDTARKLLIFRNEVGSISVFHQGGQQWIDFRKCYMYLEVHEEEEEQHSNSNRPALVAATTQDIPYAAPETQWDPRNIPETQWDPRNIPETQMPGPATTAITNERYLRQGLSQETKGSTSQTAWNGYGLFDNNAQEQQEGRVPSLRGSSNVSDCASKKKKKIVDDESQEEEREVQPDKTIFKKPEQDTEAFVKRIKDDQENSRENSKILKGKNQQSRSSHRPLKSKNTKKIDRGMELEPINEGAKPNSRSSAFRKTNKTRPPLAEIPLEEVVKVGSITIQPTRASGRQEKEIRDAFERHKNDMAVRKMMKCNADIVFIETTMKMLLEVVNIEPGMVKSSNEVREMIFSMAARILDRSFRPGLKEFCLMRMIERLAVKEKHSRKTSHVLGKRARKAFARALVRSVTEVLPAEYADQGKLLWECFSPHVEKAMDNHDWHIDVSSDPGLTLYHGKDSGVNLFT
jgi:hypothetical protein